MEDLTEIVLQYNAMRKTSGSDSETLNLLYKKIEKEVELTIYYFPVQTRKLSEEDASDFLVFMLDRINPLICRYRGKCKFEAYLKQTIRYGLLSFREKRNYNKETATILELYYKKDIDTRQGINDEAFSVSKAETDQYSLTDSQLRFKIILSHSKCARKRFVVFFLTVSPLLGVDRIEQICNITGMDFDETMELTNKICQKLKNIFTKRENIREMRNYYWYRICYLHLAMGKCCGSENDNKKAEQYRQIISSCKYHQKQRIEEIYHQRHVPYNTIAEVLSISRGTISSNTYMARKILDFCNSSDTEGLYNYPELEAIKNDKIKKRTEQSLRSFHFYPLEITGQREKQPEIAAETTLSYY